MRNKEDQRMKTGYDVVINKKHRIRGLSEIVWLPKQIFNLIKDTEYELSSIDKYLYMSKWTDVRCEYQEVLLWYFTDEVFMITVYDKKIYSKLKLIN